MVNQGIDHAEKFQSLRTVLFSGEVAIDVRRIGGFGEERIGSDRIHR